jgi:hypothetical protein
VIPHPQEHLFHVREPPLLLPLALKGPKRVQLARCDLVLFELIPCFEKCSRSRTNACTTRGGSSMGLLGIVRKIQGTSPKSANPGGKKTGLPALKEPCRRILLIAGMIGETARPVARHHGSGGVPRENLVCVGRRR